MYEKNSMLEWGRKAGAGIGIMDSQKCTLG